jgi:hypothetical protein
MLEPLRLEPVEPLRLEPVEPVEPVRQTFVHTREGVGGDNGDPSSPDTPQIQFALLQNKKESDEQNRNYSSLHQYLQEICPNVLNFLTQYIDNSGFWNDMEFFWRERELSYASADSGITPYLKTNGFNAWATQMKRGDARTWVEHTVGEFVGCNLCGLKFTTIPLYGAVSEHHCYRCGLRVCSHCLHVDKTPIKDGYFDKAHIFIARGEPSPPQRVCHICKVAIELQEEQGREQGQGVSVASSDDMRTSLRCECPPISQVDESGVCSNCQGNV